MPKIKVLVVDDEIEFATTLAERLNIRDFEATACFCTEDALALIHADEIFDVVLLDLKMPHMDGMEMLKEIKQHKPNIEVIMLTGHAAGVPLVGIDRGKHGAFDCVIKPADINELTAKIRQATTKNQTTQINGENK